MPGKLLNYSGLITKTKAMHGRLLKKADFERLVENSTVDEAVAFLRKKESYEAVFTGKSEIKHRGQAESVIMASLYSDFAKIYRFSNYEQKQYLNLIFFRYELDAIKNCLMYVCIKELSDYERKVDWYFDRLTKLNINALKGAKDLDEFIFYLRGTIYEEIMQDLRKNNIYRYGDLASALDQFYYVKLYQILNGFQDKETKQILKTIFGTQIDWMNIMWIYRRKHYYRQNPKEVKLPIPIFYHIRKEEMSELIQAPKIESMLQILAETYYFKGEKVELQMEDEFSYYLVMDRIYRMVSRKYPVSIAPVLHYLYAKETEIERVITVIEGIRYQLEAKDIRKLVLLAEVQ